MAKIKKTITGLKPDSNYLFTLKPKNVEISAIDEAPEAIRIKTPSAVGNPSNITGLTLAANFETVMFAFNPVNDIDLDYFEYRLYNNSAGTGTLINEKTATNGDSISGTAKANVFTVSVPNSTSSSNTAYWGTVRTVSTAGTRGAWVSPLVGSGNTPLIQDQYINSLTAAKITSGTISAAEIVLSGAISKIQSSSYNPSDPVGTRQGWIIRGDGTAEFSAASIRGTLTAGSLTINANNYWTPSGSTANLKVGSESKYMYFDGTTLSLQGASIQSGSILMSGVDVPTGESGFADISSARYIGYIYQNGGNGPRTRATHIYPTSFRMLETIGNTLNLPPYSTAIKSMSISDSGIAFNSRMGNLSGEFGTIGIYNIQVGVTEPTFSGGRIFLMSRDLVGGSTVVRHTIDIDTTNGQIRTTGNIYGANKYFKIPHPTLNNKYLMHASLEGRTSDVFYRGQSELVNGSIEITLPDYFESLTKEANRTINLTQFVSSPSEEPCNLGVTEIKNGKFTVYRLGNSGSLNQKFFWRVEAERKNADFNVVEDINDQAEWN